MTTYITVNVAAQKLSDQAKNTQAANRRSLTQAETDARYLEDVARIEEAELRQQGQRAREGAVPEYKTRRYTSAQRGGGSFGIGWIYETYTDAVEHAWADTERFRISVGSGDGTSWDYLELSQQIPANKPPLTVNGFYEFNNTGVYVDNVEFTFNARTTGNPGGCAGTYTITHERYSQWQRKYDLVRQNVKFIVPLGGTPDAGCILIGCARIRGKVVKEYSPIPTGNIVGLDGFYNEVTGGSFPAGANLVEVTRVSNPTQGNLRSYAVKLVEAGASSLFCYYDSPYNYSGFNGGATSNFGQPSYTYAYRNGFVPPAAEVSFSETTRVNYAFFVSSKQCRRLAVSSTLNNLLNQWLPSNDDSAWVEAVNTNTSGPAWGFVTDSGFIGSTLYGSPGIFDIIKDNFNFNLFDFDAPMFDDPGYLVSEVKRQVPITAPDFTTPQSAFSVASRIADAGLSTTITYPPPSGYTSGLAGLELNTYIYLPSSKRSSSAYYTASSAPAKALLNDTAANPVFWIWDKKINPGGLKENTLTTLPTFLPDGTYKTAARLPLAALRVLPPALFNAPNTEHPLVIPQIVRSPSGLTAFSNVFNPAIKLGQAWSSYNLTTMLWTDWGAGRQTARLSQLGITLAPYTE